MTRYQARLISDMCQNASELKQFHKAYTALLNSCSDTVLQEPVVHATPQPTVTVSTTGTTPPPPSTPQPLGPAWWKERQAEALKEQIEIIADQNKKITELQKQIERMEIQQCVDAKTIKDLKASQAASVTASNQILGALNESGLRQYDGSLADNVVSIINQCEAQEKQIESLKKEVEDRNDEIAKYVRNNASELVLANKEIIDSLRHWGLRSNTGSLVSNVTDVIKQCVVQGKQIHVMNKDLIRKDKEIGKLTQWHADSIDQVNKLGRELGQKIQENERLKKELEVAGKKQKAIIKAGNDLKYLLRDVFPDDYPLMYGCVSYCTHYISLWDDNTAPQSPAG